MSETPPVVADERPVLVHQDEAQLVGIGGPLQPLPPAPAKPAPSVPPPLPAPPPYVPFRYEQVERLSPAHLDAVTLFHAHWLQHPTYQTRLAACASEADQYKLWTDAVREAEAVTPLLRQQYREACIGVDGPESQEAQTVKRNLEWAEALLAQRG